MEFICASDLTYLRFNGTIHTGTCLDPQLREVLIQMGTRIRDATPEDCHKIIGLIQELADYEKMPQGPKLSKIELIRDGFPAEPGSRRLFRSKVAEEDGEVTGYCLYYHAWSFRGPSFYLEDVYVTPSKRRNGIGRQFFEAIAEDVLKEGDTQGLYFSVLGWNEPAISFYSKIGAVDMTADRALHAYRFTKQAMNNVLKSLNIPEASLSEAVDIRPARETDCDIICGMIRDFAIKLGISKGDGLATPEMLSNRAFPKDPTSHPTIRLLVAERSSTIIGYAMFFTSYSTWEGPSTWLENLFVVDEERNNGVGKLLLYQVMRDAVQQGSARMDWVVESKKQEVVRFYKRLGAVDITEMEDWHYFKAPKEVLAELVDQ